MAVYVKINGKRIRADLARKMFVDKTEEVAKQKPLNKMNKTELVAIIAGKLKEAGQEMTSDYEQLTKKVLVDLIKSGRFLNKEEGKEAGEEKEMGEDVEQANDQGEAFEADQELVQGEEKN